MVLFPRLRSAFSDREGKKILNRRTEREVLEKKKKMSGEGNGRKKSKKMAMGGWRAGKWMLRDWERNERRRTPLFLFPRLPGLPSPAGCFFVVV